MDKNIKYILFGAGIFTLVLVLIFFGFLPGKKSASPEPSTLEFWGVGDSGETWRGIIESFERANPNITVRYTVFDDNNYEETLINRLAEGRGPDIFMLRNVWIPKHRDKIFPLPQDVFKFTPRDLEKTFVDIVSSDLVSSKGEIIGLPLFIDTLGLFYNKDTFNTAGIAKPPTDWDDLVDISRRLTKKSPAGDIIKSGIALGTFNNIEHAHEILLSLVLQNGDNITDSKTNSVVFGDGGRDALQFYTSFADITKQNFSWNGRMRNSIQAFAETATAMVIGFSEDISRIKARNPHISFRVAPLPQPKGTEAALSFGKYVFPTVSKSSKNPIAAWQFIIFASSRDNAKNYLALTGRAPARRDLIEEGSHSADLDVFYRQSLVARDWLSPNETAAERIFKEGVETLLARSAGIDQVMQRIREQLRLILSP